jgi:SAM-dependent methyltransferase
MAAPEMFYDELADLYDLIYENWPASVERQGDALAKVIRQRDPLAKRIADVACGIGTQSLGLAARGFELRGSDISSAAIDRARREAVARGLTIAFTVDDMRRLATYDDASVDVVIACDNSLPHLLGDDEIREALRHFHRIVKPGGLCILSVRDYETIEQQAVRVIPYGIRERDGRRVVILQVWAFHGDQYDLDFFFLFDDGRTVETRVLRTRYYAIPIPRIIDLAAEAGFIDIERVDDAFFQPLIVGRRSGGPA